MFESVRSIQSMLWKLTSYRLTEIWVYDRWWESARLPVLSTLGKWAQGQASMLKIGHFGAVRHAERSHDTCNKRLCYCLVHGVALRDMSDTRNTDNKRTKWGQL